jgi:hypothetical protein
MLKWNINRKILTGKRETPKKIKKLSPFQFVHHKFHIDWRGIEPGPSGWEVDDQLWLQVVQADVR